MQLKETCNFCFSHLAYIVDPNGYLVLVGGGGNMQANLLEVDSVKITDENREEFSIVIISSGKAMGIE